MFKIQNNSIKPSVYYKEKAVLDLIDKTTKNLKEIKFNTDCFKANILGMRIDIYV